MASSPVKKGRSMKIISINQKKTYESPRKSSPSNNLKPSFLRVDAATLLRKVFQE
jgi:hypothetical protein